MKYINQTGLINDLVFALETAKPIISKQESLKARIVNNKLDTNYLAKNGLFLLLEKLEIKDVKWLSEVIDSMLTALFEFPIPHEIQEYKLIYKWNTNKSFIIINLFDYTIEFSKNFEFRVLDSELSEGMSITNPFVFLTLLMGYIIGYNASRFVTVSNVKYFQYQAIYEKSNYLNYFGQLTQDINTELKLNAEGEPISCPILYCETLQSDVPKLTVDELLQLIYCMNTYAQLQLSEFKKLATTLFISEDCMRIRSSESNVTRKIVKKLKEIEQKWIIVGHNIRREIIISSPFTDRYEIYELKENRLLYQKYISECKTIFKKSGVHY